MRRFLLLLAVASVALAAVPGAGAFPVSGRAVCTVEQQLAKQDALERFQRGMAAARRAYFRKHKSAAARTAYVRAQQKKLRALRAAANCTIVGQTAPPAPASALGHEPTYVFGPTITAAEQTETRGNVNRARVYLAKIGALPPSPYTFYVEGDAESTAQRWSQLTGSDIDFSRTIWSTATGVAGAGYVLVYAGQQGWRSGSEGNRAKITAHELFHVTQLQLSNGRERMPPTNGIPALGPRWLLEGAAEVAGYRAWADAGFGNYTIIRDGFAEAARQVTTPLATCATTTPDAQNACSGPFYSISSAAVEYLMRGRDFAEILGFWRALGTGMPWQQAFVSTFGRSIETFYGEFETHRRQ
jgi:hypothetical protein